ncbi:ABC transporter permease subunit [Sinorhizobium meliloti]|nr:ABC transporter permease subunit [Sinorhizobium meliloti]
MTYLEIASEVARGIPVSLGVAIGGIVVGCVLACFLVMARLSRNVISRFLSWIFLEIIRCIPMIALLFLLYYGLSQFSEVRSSIFWPILREPLWCAIIALSLKACAYISEIYRIGIISVPEGEILAARSFGFKGFRLYRSIIVPYAARIVLPALSNEFVVLIKASSLASLITLMDITGLASGIASELFQPLPALTVAAVYYLVFNTLVLSAFQHLERRLAI